MHELHERCARGGEVMTDGPGRWTLKMPQGPSGVYRWAQLDDHLHKKRRNFPCSPPVRLELRARVSSPDIAGTWGFGLWNDPFSLSFRVAGAEQRLPALPNAAWFFNASPPNYLAFRNDHPAQGFLAATFRAPHIPAILLGLGLPALPLLAVPPTARLLRRAASSIIQESGVQVEGDVTAWRHYRLDWLADCVRFYVDGRMIQETRVSPAGPLGVVIWIDNQYVGFPPSGQLRAGLLSTPEDAWLEIDELTVNG